MVLVGEQMALIICSRKLPQSQIENGRVAVRIGFFSHAPKLSGLEFSLMLDSKKEWVTLMSGEY
jgi:hypothetical protein